MVEIDVAAVLPGDDGTGLTGITDLAVLPDPAGDILYAVTREGTLTAWRITDDGLETLGVESLPATPTAGLEAGLAVIETAEGTPMVLVTGAGGLWTAETTAQGGLSDVAVVSTASGGLPPDLALVAEVAAGGQSYLVGVCRGSEQPGLWRIGADGGLTQVAAPGAGQQTAAGLGALAVLETGGASYVLGAAADSQALVIWRVGADGLTETGRIGAADGIGIATPSALALVEAHGETYAILGAAGSSSLTVVAIGADGEPVLADHILDTLDTRFQGVTALEAATFGGRSYVLAAGADDGLSLFELLPGGRLVHLATLADSFDTTLANVSDLAVSVTATGLQVTVASAAEPGLTLLNVTLPQGQVLTAAAAGDVLTGGADDDLLVGGPGDDRLEGGPGDDVILDGAGSDTLVGGAGADIFVLSADGMTDTIADFDPAQDMLDLSAWAFLRGTAQLTVIETPDGAEIWYGDERLILYSADGGPITADEIAGLEILSVDRMLPEWSEDLIEAPAETAPDQVLSGTAGDDYLEGGTGNDSLSGQDGNDTLRGGDGHDTLIGGAGDDVLEGGEGNDVLNGGGGNDTLFGGNGDDFIEGKDGDDVIEGGPGDDTLYGNSGRDTIYGGSGSDYLNGGPGSDALYGNDGDDWIEGKDGFDTIYGGAGNDTLSGDNGHDLIHGGEGDDLLIGGPGADTLYGDAGDDWIEGVANYDEIHGGAGNDSLFGGDGNDTLYGGDGNDLLIGGTQNDALYGGDGHDMLEGRANFDLMYGGGGSDTLYGGDGHDTLYGDTGNDVLVGGPGGDLIYGGAGHDLIEGGANNDLLYGDAGNDTLYGGDGRDTLYGGDGDDLLHGGPGADVFVFTEGADTIADFDPAMDRIVLDGGPGTLTAAAFDAVLAAAVQAGGSVVLDFGAAGTLTLADLSDPSAALDPGLFGF